MPQTERRLDALWANVRDYEIQAVRAVLADAVRHHKQPKVRADAGVFEHDLRNFLSHASEKPKYRPGLRLLCYAASYETSDPEIQKSVAIAQNTMRHLSYLDPDDDYFFKYLNDIKVINANQCEQISDNMSGSYYAHRLGLSQGIIMRSHLQIKAYNPYNKVPRFINKLKYGRADDRRARTRKAEGQIFSLNQTYIFLAFIFDGSTPKSDYDYRGLKLIITPYENFNHTSARSCNALFVSYSHEGQYEYGPMIITKTTDPYKEDQIGEMPEEYFHGSIDLSSLKTNVSLMGDARNSDLVATCFSYVLSGFHRDKSAPSPVSS